LADFLRSEQLRRDRALGVLLAAVDARGGFPDDAA
jgi:hypothetical protein